MVLKYFDIPVYFYHRAVRASVSDASGEIPVVLIHAFPVDHHVWDGAAQSLVRQFAEVKQDVTVLAVDMPGAGANPVPAKEYVGEIAPDGAYTEAMDRLASSIVSTVQSQGFQRAIYVGISMGGYATLAIARLFPEAVAGIALCDTKADADNAVQRARRLEAAEVVEKESSLGPVLHFAQPHDGDSVFKKSSAFIDTFTSWINAQTPAGIAWRQRMAAGRRDEHKTLGEITAPVAVISGELDDSSNPEVMKPLAEQIAHADVKFTQIDDAGHFTSFEKPDDVAAALLDLVLRVQAKAESDESAAAPATVQAVHIPTLNVYQPLETVPMSEGNVNWRIDKREKLAPGDVVSLLGAENAEVILVNDGKLAVAKNGISATVTTANKRRLAVIPGKYVTKMLANCDDALYYLGEVMQASTGRSHTLLALNVSKMAHGGAPELGADADTQFAQFAQRARMQFDWFNLREIAPQLSADESQLSVMATGLAAWHARSKFCSVCGASNHDINGGWAKKCAGEGAHVAFPKVEPAMIVRITDSSDRILLQHNHAWEERMYSICSGFVEVGENIEHAIHREVKEELGIDVDDVRYLGSQPWPLPASLMVGYSAHSDANDMVLDTREVADARWFTRDELMNALTLGEVKLAGPSSIAMAMIEQWYGASLR